MGETNMPKIVKMFKAEVAKRTIRRCRERGIIIPTSKQMRNSGIA